MLRLDTSPELLETSSDILEESLKNNTDKVWFNWSTQSPKNLITPLSLIKEAEDTNPSTFLILNLWELTIFSLLLVDLLQRMKKMKKNIKKLEMLTESSSINTILLHSPTDGFSLFRTNQEKKNMWPQTASWPLLIWFNNLTTLLLIWLIMRRLRTTIIWSLTPQPDFKVTLLPPTNTAMVTSMSLNWTTSSLSISASCLNWLLVGHFFSPPSLKIS